MHPSHLIVTFPPDPSPLRATLQASYHRLWVRGDVPPPASKRWRTTACMLEAATSTPLIFLSLTPHTRPDDRGYRQVSGTNKVLMTTPTPPPPPQLTQLNNCCPGPTVAPSLSSVPTIVPAPQLLKWIFISFSNGWIMAGEADDLTCPDCRTTNHTVAHLFSCPSHPTDLAPGDMWVTPLQVAQFLAEFP